MVSLTYFHQTPQNDHLGHQNQVHLCVCQQYAEHYRHINHHSSQLDLGHGHPCLRQFKDLDPSMNLGDKLKTHLFTISHYK